MKRIKTMCLCRHAIRLWTIADMQIRTGWELFPTHVKQALALARPVLTGY